MTEAVIRTEPLDGRAGSALVAAFIAEISPRYPGWGPGVGPSADPHEFVHPHGSFVVAYVDDRPVACGGVKRLPDGKGEIKRVYVQPEHRGQGVGRRLLSRLETAALELGCDTVRLDTGDKQPDAFALFVSAGYHQIDDYNANPFASYWFEKAIRPS